jgi:hypothetical protein
MCRRDPVAELGRDARVSVGDVLVLVDQKHAQTLQTRSAAVLVQIHTTLYAAGQDLSLETRYALSLGANPTGCLVDPVTATPRASRTATRGLRSASAWREGRRAWRRPSVCSRCARLLTGTELPYLVAWDSLVTGCSALARHAWVAPPGGAGDGDCTRPSDG